MYAPEIGEVFEYEDKMYKCVKAINDCHGCIFDFKSEEYCPIQLECYAEDRPDETEVIFVNV